MINFADDAGIDNNKNVYRFSVHCNGTSKQLYRVCYSIWFSHRKYDKCKTLTTDYWHITIMSNKPLIKITFYQSFINLTKALKLVFKLLCRQVTNNRRKSKRWWDMPTRANWPNSSVCQYCVKHLRYLSFCSIWDVEKQGAAVHSGTDNYRSRGLEAVQR